MKLIGIEEHLLTPEVADAWAAVAADDPTAAFHEGQLGDRLMDLAELRLGLMDETGLDVQVLSLTPPGLHNLESGASVDLARRTNDRIADSGPSSSAA